MTLLIDDQQLNGLISTFVEHVSDRPCGSANRREHYFDCLNKVQKLHLHYRTDRAEPIITVDLTNKDTQAVIESLLLSEEMQGSSSIDSIDTKNVPEVIRNITEAEYMLRAYDPTASRYFHDLVAEIILLQKNGYISGSFPHLLGAIWISVHNEWQVIDWAEALLHESIHQSMFLTDMVRGLFKCSDKELGSPEMLVMSSIRGIRRPYDTAFHAATVSATLINFYEWVGQVDRARKLCSPLLRSICELDERRNRLTDIGTLILDRIIDLVSSSSSFQHLKESVAV